jgi:hypothetical protein
MDDTEVVPDALSSAVSMHQRWSGQFGRGSRFFAPKGPELVEGLDPKPLNVRATVP